MSRPTREFTTSNGTGIILNTYITGGENWEIRDIYLKAGADAGLIAKEAEKKAFALVVVSVNGSNENIIDKIMAMPLDEYQELSAEVTPIIEGKKK